MTPATLDLMGVVEASFLSTGNLNWISLTTSLTATLTLTSASPCTASSTARHAPTVPHKRRNQVARKAKVSVAVGIFGNHQKKIIIKNKKIKK